MLAPHPAPSSPTPQQSLTATPMGNSVRLDWLPPQDMAGLTLEGYYVYRAAKPGGYDWTRPLHDFLTTDTFYVDNTCQVGRTYYYRVKAYFTNKSHTAYNEVSFTPGQNVIVITVGNPIAQVNGQPVTMDQPPIIHNGRALLPFRFASERLGAELVWIQATQQVKAKHGNTTVILTIGSYEAKVNGVSVEIDVSAILVNDRTMVPVRFLTTAFGWKVEWVHSTKTVVIYAGSGK